MFYYGVRYNGLGKRAHVLKYLHGICVVGTFERCFHEGSILRLHRAVI